MARSTRINEKNKQSSVAGTAAAKNGDIESAGAKSLGRDVTFTEGPLPEMWIASGNAEHYELITLPDPKTSKPRQFVVIVRSNKEAEGYSRHRAALGELRTFETATPASFLVESSGTSSSGVNQGDDDEDADATNAATTDNREERVFTTKQTLSMVSEIDPAFLLLPALSSADARERNTSRFLPLDDIMETWGAMPGSQASHLMEDVHEPGQLTTSASSGRYEIHQDLKNALGRICDSVDAGGEMAYRFSLAKFEALMMDKAVRLAKSGLPQSLEDRALKLVERTQMPTSTEEESPTDTPPAADTPGQLSVTTNDTQESIVSAIFSQESHSTAAPSPVSGNGSGVSAEIGRLVRTRVALGFILANYVPEHVSEDLITRIDKDVSANKDFGSLREHMERKRESEKRIDVSRLYSNKRSADDDERLEERAEKRRKQEEEEKKKKEASAGVKSLAKVNTKGMMKMTSFFQAKPKKE